MDPANGSVFLLKLDNSGNFAWARALGSSGWLNGADLGVFDQNHIYVAAGYYGPTDLDPGPGVFTVTPASSLSDVFLARFGASGNFISGGSVGGKMDEYASKICFNSTGSVYLAGYFKDTADVDPGAGVSQVIAPDTGSSVFVLKLTPTLSVGDVSGATDVHIYPNPTSGKLTIETGNSSYDTYSIVNSVGAQVSVGSVSGSNASVDVSALPSGVYHMILKGKDGVVTSRVTKL
jgi:hypothetical protein